MSGWNEMGRRVGSHLTPQNRKSQRRHSDRYRSDTYTVAPLLSVRRADRIASAALSSYFTLFFRFRCGSQLTHTKSLSHRKLSLVESNLSIYLSISFSSSFRFSCCKSVWSEWRSFHLSIVIIIWLIFFKIVSFFFFFLK